ncbi:hypothetical protein HAX54_007366, partial [Datura stramonium]|nr:hypothetical protein [Datura stramonium]
GKARHLKTQGPSGHDVVPTIRKDRRDNSLHDVKFEARIWLDLGESSQLIKRKAVQKATSMPYPSLISMFLPMGQLPLFRALEKPVRADSIPLVTKTYKHGEI